MKMFKCRFFFRASMLAAGLMTAVISKAATISSVDPSTLGGDPLDSTRTITFTNASGSTADDLHIVFSQSTTVTTNPFGNDRVNDPASNKTHNFWGMSVANTTGMVTLAFSTNAIDLTIAQWWWTTGGNATTNGTQVGKTNKDTGGTTLSFLGPPATGDGALLVQINGTNNTFTTTAGFTATQEAAALELFLGGLQVSGFPLINVTMPTSNTDNFVGNLLGDPTTELNVSVLSQDSTQQILLAPFPQVPEPGTFLLLGFGIGLIGIARQFWFRPY
jgi:hypothetical protein